MSDLEYPVNLEIDLPLLEPEDQLALERIERLKYVDEFFSE